MLLRWKGNAYLWFWSKLQNPSFPRPDNRRFNVINTVPALQNCLVYNQRGWNWDGIPTFLVSSLSATDNY